MAFTSIKDKSNEDELLCVNSTVQFGTFNLHQKEWLMEFKCNFCGILYRNFQRFIRHSIKHIVEESKDHMDDLIAKAVEDDEEYFSDENSSHFLETIQEREIKSNSKNEDCFAVEELNNDVRCAANSKDDNNGLKDLNLPEPVIEVAMIELELQEKEKMKDSQIEVKNPTINSMKNVENLKIETIFLDTSEYLNIEGKPRAEYPVGNMDIIQFEDGTLGKSVIENMVSYEKSNAKTQRRTPVPNLDQVYYCEECGVKFDTRRKLNNHQKRHHAKQTDGFEVFTCHKCNEVFPLYKNLRYHRAKCHSKNDFLCDICNIPFKDRANYIVHRSRHLGIKPHVCKICDKRFTTSSELKGHMRSHSDERPYVCEICGKSFTLSHKLGNHKRTHANERQYGCAQCDKRFNVKHLLTSHLRTHLNVKPYECDICHAKFLRRTGLNVHRKIHLDVYEYKCPYCDKAFKQSPGLHSHLKTHKKSCPA